MRRFEVGAPPWLRVTVIELCPVTVIDADRPLVDGLSVSARYIVALPVPLEVKTGAQGALELAVHWHAESAVMVIPGAWCCQSTLVDDGVTLIGHGGGGGWPSWLTVAMTPKAKMLEKIAIDSVFTPSFRR